jgi:hypothetical protein
VVVVRVVVVVIGLKIRKLLKVIEIIKGVIVIIVVVSYLKIRKLLRAIIIIITMVADSICYYQKHQINLNFNPLLPHSHYNLLHHQTNFILFVTFI